MSGLTGPEWRGESLPYGTIVFAPTRGIVAMVLTSQEGALVNGWHRLGAGQHAVVSLDRGRWGFGNQTGSVTWMLDYDLESIRWHVSLEDRS